MIDILKPDQSVVKIRVKEVDIFPLLLSLKEEFNTTLISQLLFIFCKSCHVPGVRDNR